MSTIQTQIAISHLESQLSIGDATQRTSVESSASFDSISVATSDETVDLGDVVDAKQVFLKLVSGDNLRVGFDGSAYPLRLSEASESMLLRLDVEGLVETSTIVVTAEDANTTLHEQFFTLEGASGTWGVWFDVGGGGSDPTGAYDNSLEITGVVTSGAIGVVGQQLYDELVSDAGFLADFAVAYDSGTYTLTITDRFTGTRTNIADGSATTVFAFATTQEGAAAPVVHLKSLGTSEVVVAVLPN
jgi:hypothetical protein